jgi:hypothetical protein
MSTNPLSTNYQPDNSVDYHPYLPTPATFTSLAGQSDTGASTRPSPDGRTLQPYLLPRLVRDLDRPHQPPLATGKKSLDAVIVAVTDTTITINCHLAGRMTKLELVRAIFPEELAHYGQPVRLAIDRTMGTRRLLVEPRTVPHREQSSIERELQAWVDSAD